MRLLTPEENRFLDVFLHEATTAPFTGPATKALHKTGVEYGDISYIAWAYEQEVPRTGFAVGHAADVRAAAPLAEPTVGTPAKPGNPADLGAATTRRRGVGGTE